MNCSFAIRGGKFYLKTFFEGELIYGRGDTFEKAYADLMKNCLGLGGVYFVPMRIVLDS